MDDFDSYLEKKAEQMQERVRRLLANPAFQESIIKTRSELALDPALKTKGFPVELQLKIAPHIRRIRREFDLDFRWETFLSKYILWGIDDGYTFGPLIRGIKDKVTGKDVLSILVLESTRVEDVIRAYRLIAKHHRKEGRTAGYIGRRSDLYDNLERDALWYEWHNDEGMSSRKIARRYALEKGKAEPHHTTVLRGIKKFERIILNREK